ncbi:MAG: hypothetical protein ACFB13_07445 [Kiloniellaceae bacterium]
MYTIDASPQKSDSGTKGYGGRLSALVTLVSALALLAAAVLGARPAAAEPAGQSGGPAPQCGAREAVLDRLSSKYAEHPVSIGVTATGSLLEVLASADGNTWTIIVTVPGGPTCLVSSGEGWHNAPVQLAEDPAV